MKPTEFLPPALLRHPDVQNIVSSAGLRAWLLRRRWAQHDSARRTLLLDCGAGVRLQGEYNPALDRGDRPAQALAVLFHGWEGCTRSAYIQSAALSLVQAGFDVFRLNFRDHGESHHLNRELFNSTLLDEVLGALAAITREFPRQHYVLAGFSLGGNFALRCALAAPSQGIPLAQVTAVCPVIDPEHTLYALENSSFFYEPYFVKKWRDSLLKKLAHFPDYDYGDELKQLKSLRAMHDFFVPRFTGFPNRQSYFKAYSLNAKRLAEIQIPTLIVNSLDDPITRADILPAAMQSTYLSLEVAPYGSHCAFIEDFQLNSWIDRKLVHSFQSALPAAAFI